MENQRQPSAARGRPLLPRARERLLEAGLALAAGPGLQKATAARLAAQARVGKGTFFNHFGSKERYLADLAAWLLEELLQRTRTQLLSAAGAEDVLAGAISATLRFLAARPGAAQVLAGLVAGPEGPPGRALARYAGEMQGLVGPALERAGLPPGPAGGLALLAGAAGWFAAAAALGQTPAPGPGLDRLAFGLARGLLASP